MPEDDSDPVLFNGEVKQSLQTKQDFAWAVNLEICCLDIGGIKFGNLFWGKDESRGMYQGHRKQSELQPSFLGDAVTSYTPNSAACPDTQNTCCA